MTIACLSATRSSPPRRREGFRLPEGLMIACPAARRRRSRTTAIDAERAFAADAQKIGQWTAFRK